MKAVILTQGKIAVVDDEDFDRVSAFKWYAVRNGHYKPTGRCAWEARRTLCGRPKRKEQRMQHLILGTDQLADHKNGDSLWNTRGNLRVATRAQNQFNKRPSLKASRRGRFKGTFFDKRKQKWTAKIGFNYKSIHLGSFATEIEAARAYDKAALVYFGEFALTNEQIFGGISGF